MPYAIPESASLEWLLDYVVGAEAALGALPITAPQAVPWTAFRATLRTARDKRDDDRFALKSASAIARVADAEWDRTLVALSGEAYHLAGKKADELPYAALFGGLKASEATRLGAFKATAFGTALLHKVAVLEDARLASVTGEFAAAQAQLAAATNARIAAKGRAQSHDAGRQLHLDHHPACTREGLPPSGTAGPKNATTGCSGASVAVCVVTAFGAPACPPPSRRALGPPRDVTRRARPTPQGTASGCPRLAGSRAL